MDSYRLPRDPIARRRELERTALRRPGYVGPDIGGTHGLPIPAAVEPQPVHIGRNVWIGFDACVLPGVSIGDGSVVGAKSVVTEDVPPYTVVAGNPARVIRRLQPQELDAKSIEMMSLELRSAGAREAAEGIDHGR
jgi:tetrahydrodipicolinate N-succinyltransferase